MYSCFSVLTKLSCGDSACQEAVREVDAAGLAVTAMKRHPQRADVVEYCLRLFTTLTQIPLVTKSPKDLVFATDVIKADGLSQALSAMRYHKNEASLVVFGIRALGNIGACSVACNKSVIDADAIPFLASILLQEVPSVPKLRRLNAAMNEGAIVALYNIVVRDPTGMAREAAVALGVKLEWLNRVELEMDKGTVQTVTVKR